MHTTRAAMAGVMAALLVAGCGGNGTPTAEQAVGGSWVLVEGQGPDGEVPLVEEAPITLDVEDGEIGGTAACNTYGGTVDVDGQQLSIRELYQTEMACEPTRIMDSEAAYLRALQAVDAHARDGDRLELTGEDTRLVFDPREVDAADDEDDDQVLDPDEPVSDEPEPAPETDEY
jgi:heat shock protein HslJ